MMYKYNLRLAARFLLRSISHLKTPPNYWRTAEYRIVLNEGNFDKSDVILDIGSPKDLCLYLSRVIGAKVYATDINDYFIDSIGFLRQFEEIPKQKLHLKVEDGRNLTFDNNYFSKIYSISVLEHIPDSGDTECIKEIARVLSNGGKCIITVPFSPESKNDYRDESAFYWSEQYSGKDSGKSFYQRRYSEQDLYDRLITPSGLTLDKLQFIGERIFTNSNNELIDILPKWTAPIEPLMSNLFLSKPVTEWKSLKKPLCAIIVLKKQ